MSEEYEGQMQLFVPFPKHKCEHQWAANLREYGVESCVFCGARIVQEDEDS